MTEVHKYANFLIIHGGINKNCLKSESQKIAIYIYILNRNISKLYYYMKIPDTE